MESQDDYYEEYYGKSGRRRKRSPWRIHIAAIAILVAVGAIAVASGVTDRWLSADNDQEAHTIDVHNLDALR